MANSNKTRTLVRRGQEEFKERLDAYIDEKLAALGKGDPAPEGAEPAKKGK